MISPVFRPMDELPAPERKNEMVAFRPPVIAIGLFPAAGYIANCISGVLIPEHRLGRGQHLPTRLIGGIHTVVRRRL